MEGTQISAALFDRDLALLGMEVESFDPIRSLEAGINAVTKIVNQLKASLPRSTHPPSELALAVNAIRLDQQRLVS